MILFFSNLFFPLFFVFFFHHYELSSQFSTHLRHCLRHLVVTTSIFIAIFSSTYRAHTYINHLLHPSPAILFNPFLSGSQLFPRPAFCPFFFHLTTVYTLPFFGRLKATRGNFKCDLKFLSRRNDVNGYDLLSPELVGWRWNLHTIHHQLFASSRHLILFIGAGENRDTNRRRAKQS